jgi:hypothetical protein
MRVVRQLTGNGRENLYSVHIDGGQGVQIGGENTQINRYEPST